MSLSKEEAEDKGGRTILSFKVMESFLRLFVTAQEVHRMLRDRYSTLYLVGAATDNDEHQVFKRFEDAILEIGSLLPYSQEELEDGYPTSGRLETSKDRVERWKREGRVYES